MANMRPYIRHKRRQHRGDKFPLSTIIILDKVLTGFLQTIHLWQPETFAADPYGGSL